MNSRYVPLILIALSIVVAIILQLNDPYSPTWHESLVLDANHILSLWSVFSFTQLAFMLLGYIGYRVFVREKLKRKNYILYPLPRIFIVLAAIGGFLCAAPMIISYPDHQGSVDMTFLDVLQEEDFWFLTYVWFANGYIAVFYASVFLIFVYDALRRMIRP
jgi:hypothetical protein